MGIWARAEGRPAFRVAECEAGVKLAGWHDFCSGGMHAIDVVALDRRGVVRGAGAGWWCQRT